VEARAASQIFIAAINISDERSKAPGAKLKQAGSVRSGSAIQFK
jgi:hypothetical protein